MPGPFATTTGDAPADPYKAANLEEEVPLEHKIGQLVEFMNKCKFGMMTTRDATDGRLVSRCMALAATETDGVDLLFYTNTETHKTDELTVDPHVNIAFLDSSGSWASVAGKALIQSGDRELVRRYYTPSLRAWVGDLGDGIHDGSENDPRVAVIRVVAETATYSVAEGTFVGRAAEVAKGAITGKPPKVNRLREITAVEVERWREAKRLRQ